MNKENISAEKRLFALFKRLRNLELDHCSEMDGTISPAQMTLLEQIASHPGSGVQDIAQQLNLTSPTVSVGVAKLEENGLVERKTNPSDKRSVQFFLTDEGESRYQRFTEVRLRRFRRLLAGLDEEEQQTFLRLMECSIESAEQDH
ncbi:MAG: MarR family transcriptional regulator [Chloroflexota bacterium]|jgi:DNA-binding MarR family transcriptional regulator|nr:MarR family transcriptional regulator [Chloroflexota bacterium]